MSPKKILKKFTPKFLLGWYHYCLAFLGALVYFFPSRNLIVIGVTGTSGKTTTVDFITRILEESGKKVASISSVRFKIADKEWKNEMKMSMAGRFKNQKFLRQAKRAGCTHVVLEVTSEGIKQSRHKFINFDTAVFTNLSPEHLESHGGIENYRNEKLKLFRVTKKVHVLNLDDTHINYFVEILAERKFTFGIENTDADVNATDVKTLPDGVEFQLQNTKFKLQVLGRFNVGNAVAAIAVAGAQGVSLEICKLGLEKVKGMPGRMEVVSQNPLVIVDYAHTPEQLEKVYQGFSGKNIIGVLGSCGGGRDKWKRPVLGKIAAQYCKEIIVTNEDPYDEDPLEIMEQVAEGIGEKPHYIVIDRQEAIKKALEMAKPEDVVIITGKGSEVWMCLENGKKISWDDRQIVRSLLSERI